VAYEVAPIFLIRMAGVPFDAVDRLATPETLALVRELVACRKDCARAIAEAEKFFRSPERLLSEEAFRMLLASVRQGSVPTPVEGVQPPVFTNYANAAANLAATESKIDSALKRELEIARATLFKSARTFLPQLLIFNVGGVRELLINLLTIDTSGDSVLPRRNARAGDRERHLLLYLQRVATKNDTFSEFGPSGWGKIDNSISGVALAPLAGIAAREAFLERWTAHAIAAAINADPEMSQDKMEVPALEPHAFEILRDDVEKWRSGPVRDRWLSILQPIAELPQKFAVAEETKDRQLILDEASARLGSLGITHKAGERFLYAAVNPIGEECFRECNFRISPKLLNEVAVEAAPWIDLWRDSYAFIASRVAAGLRQVLEKTPTKNGALPLPAFLHACETARLPLTGPGLVALAVMAFQEVKAAFRKRIQPHAGLEEYELTGEDCHVIRDTFEYPKFDEYTYPSADLQISAPTADAIQGGEYQWLVSELHPPPALLHHCMYWACPDKAALNDALARTVGGKPNFHFGFFAADFTAHTTVRIFDALPKLSNFVAPQRSNPAWRTVPPAEAEVYIDEATGDVCLRKIDNHEHLGSFARAWVIPLGFHPFQFGLTPHTPRLRCGKVIVQRRTWTVGSQELPAGNYNGISRDLVLAIEQLRAEKNWPRYIYIRPTEQALRRSGAEGRDKDTKPVFIDLESYLFLEIFYRWLTKSGELEVTEMLPAPDQLFWRETDGRRTFELRTLIIPRS
jgi:hypothetical protein